MSFKKYRHGNNTIKIERIDQSKNIRNRNLENPYKSLIKNLRIFMDIFLDNVFAINRCIIVELQGLKVDKFPTNLL